MNRVPLASVAFVMLAVVLVDASAQDPKTKATPKTATPPAGKPNPAPSPAPARPPSSASPQPPQATAPAMSTDELAIRKSSDTYASAFNKHDAKATAELYTTDAEYVDEDGDLTLGRAAIEEGLKVFFKTNPDCKLDIKVLAVRVIAPNVAIEDGLTTVIAAKDATSSVTRYTAVHSKTAGEWLLASVRDTSVPSNTENQKRLSQFEWMLGEWIHQGTDATIIFECYPIANGNFLIRDFKIQIGASAAVAGSQRIGWDAQAGKFKAWIFDSDGGFSEGYWHRDGDTWVLKTTGVTSKGQSASSTTIYALENPHTMTFQSVDHELAGHEFPDSPKVKIVRQPPRPE